MGPLRKKEYEAERLRAAMALRDRLFTRTAYAAPIAPTKPPSWGVEIYAFPIGPKPLDRIVTPSSQEIIEWVSTAHGFSVPAVIGPSRHAPLVRVRDVAVWCCRALTGASLPAIAKRFGGRDHTTLIDSLRRASERYGLPSAHSIDAPDAARLVLLHGIDRASEMWRARGDA